MKGDSLKKFNKAGLDLVTSGFVHNQTAADGSSLIFKIFV